MTNSCQWHQCGSSCCCPCQESTSQRGQDLLSCAVGLFYLLCFPLWDVSTTPRDAAARLRTGSDKPENDSLALDGGVENGKALGPWVSAPRFTGEISHSLPDLATVVQILRSRQLSPSRPGVIISRP